MSHPSRVRGLKLEKAGIVEDDGYVAPFTGAWIEIPDPFIDPVIFRAVAPFTGAWIEIQAAKPACTPADASHPSRVRGLKYHSRRPFHRS